MEDGGCKKRHKFLTLRSLYCNTSESRNFARIFSARSLRPPEKEDFGCGSAALCSFAATTLFELQRIFPGLAALLLGGFAMKGYLPGCAKSK